MNPKIEIEGLRKAFGANRVLDGVDLTIDAGESLVVIGGSGSGKSVLLKCVLGLLAPDGGRIAIDGVDVLRCSTRKARELRAQIGMLFQGGALFDSLPIWQNVSFAPLQRGAMSRDQAHEHARRMLAKVNLGPAVADRFPAEISGGMQKRVALARAIATDPSILFFDEPTTGLDPITADVINDLIRNASTDLGATSLSITHDMASARKIADRVAMLYQGKIIWTGGVADLDNPGNAHVDQFVHGRAEGPIGAAGAPA